MPERDGKGQGEDSPKQACSCWFAPHSWLATGGASLYHPGVFFCLFADAISPFSGVTFSFRLYFWLRFVFVCFAFIELFSICMHTCGPGSHTQLADICLVSFFVSFL